MRAMKDIDVVIGGFPCTPFSVMNLGRHNSRPCFEDPNSTPFLEIGLWLHNTPMEDLPKIVILENVCGLRAKSSDIGGSPMAFVLRGKWRGPNGEVVKVGLDLLSTYIVRFVELLAWDFGVPQRRPRICFVLVRNDIGNDDTADSICDNLSKLRDAMPLSHIDDFLLEPSEDTSLRHEDQGQRCGDQAHKLISTH